MSAEVVLDVSELEAPEPLMRTLAAAETLGPGQYLRMTHRRFPCLLQENLEKRGFACAIVEQGDVVTSYIWRVSEQELIPAPIRHPGPPQ